MKIDLWTIGFQAINVLILVFLLSKLFFRPVARAIADRQAYAQGLLDDAAHARAEAEAEREALKATRAAIDVERAESLRATMAHAAEARDALLVEAHAEADHIRAETQMEIAHARATEQRALQQEACRLALDLAGKVLTRLPPGATLDGLTERLAAGMAALPGAAREALRDASPPVTLAAATPLPAATAQACRETLSRVLGHPVEVAIAHDPSLIAGYELRLPEAIVRDNVRADLDRLAAALLAPHQGDMP